MTASLADYARFLLRYLRPRWRGTLSLAVLLFGGVGLQLLGPQIVRSFIDAARVGSDRGTLVLVAVLFLGVAALTQAVSVAEGFVADSVGWSATNALRAELLEQCLELDLSFHNVHPPGELIERVDGDVSTLANFFSRFVLRDNLTFSDPNVSDDRLLNALQELGLREWCEALPRGLDTELGSGGGGLSAGEAQLVTLARVFLRDPGLVILDDGRIVEHDRRERLSEDASSGFSRLLRTSLAEVTA